MAPLDLIATARLDFEAPDEGRFPRLRLARRRWRQANRDGHLQRCQRDRGRRVSRWDDPFTAIPLVIEQTLERMTIVEPTSLAVVESADA